MLGNHVILQLKYNEKLDFTELPSFSSKPTYNSIFNSVNSRSSVTILFFLWASPPIWQVVTCKCNRHLQTPVNLEYPLEYESATELSEKRQNIYKKNDMHICKSLSQLLWHGATRSIDFMKWLGCQTNTDCPPALCYVLLHCANTHLFSWLESNIVTFKCFAWEHSALW